ncbi:hypothetical protein GPL15_00325 [Clostridium sp. MCC353]|uniref:Ltp family lipoprotein n=1 Tax=Clostridium sp. MCC353 TaxID=2592646 RepID=UPI001C01C912|nr:Ltp family lipoprotein [Clostridium sp. MCC353]MBT9774953.1 hypothetical protein [Clostridium sp. MCC353]
MKKHFIILSLLVLSLTACSNGVSQSDYDSLKADYENLKGKYEEALEKLEDNSSKSSGKSSKLLNKVSDFTDSKIKGTTVAEAQIGTNKLLYITTTSDSEDVSDRVGELLLKDWFDYDYVLWTRCNNYDPIFTVRYEKDTNALLSHFWISDTESSSSSSSTKKSTGNKASSNNISLGKKNALNSALSYLNVLSFSYSGLIEQLEYEGYSIEEATYAADNCGADWNAQAAKKAQEYISVLSFSRSGLIEQLEYDGFTNAQAEYGAAAVGY